jgi:hypothetical protein
MKLPTLILLLCAAGAASAQQPPAPPREHRGPPQEFLDACKGKKEGEAVRAKGPRGEMMSGTCRMVMMPTRPADDGKQERPPRQ